MSFEIELRPPVLSDLDEAFGWYEAREDGLGVNFIKMFSAVLPMLRRNPAACAFWYRDVRHVMLKRFPYAVYFRVEGSKVVIFRVYHSVRSGRGLRQSLRDQTP